MTQFLTREPDGSLREIIGLSNSDAFGRQRVSSPQTLFQLNHIYDKQPLYIEEKFTSGATTTHLPNEAAVQLNVTTTVGSMAVRQTKKYFHYQAGKSQLVLLTGVLTNVSNTGIISRIGYFDDTADKTVDTGGDGIFFEYSNGQLHIVKRSFISGVQNDTKITQGSWNQGDQLNGLGPSGITIDPTKAQIFWFDMEWLGVGTVRAGIIHNGAFLHLHSFHHANIIGSAYMRRATLPVRYEITRVSGTTAGSMKQICMSVTSEGGQEETGRVHSYPTPAAKFITTSIRQLVSVRLKSRYNRASLIPVAIDLMATSNQYVTYYIVYGGTITGGTWSDFDTLNSGVEINTTATVTGGRVINSGFMSSATRQVSLSIDSFDTPLVSIAGEVEALSLLAKSTGNTSIYGGLTWREGY